MKNKLRFERLPLSIYRVGPARIAAQEQGFDFLKELLPYLSSMGFSTLSLPTVFQTKIGHPSALGRSELVSFSRVNRDFGGDASFQSVTSILDEEYSTMSLVLDLEPQFMSLSSENEAAERLLLDGPCAVSSELFDIDWKNGRSRPGTVALPILSESYLDAIKKRRLRFEFFRSKARFTILYEDLKFPVCPRSLTYFFAFASIALIGTEFDQPQVLKAINELESTAKDIPSAQLLSQKKERLEKVKSFATLLRKMVLDVTWLGRALEHAAEMLNREGRQPTEVLHNLIYSQPYQFFHKQSGAARQNYRSCNDDAFTIAADIGRRTAFEAVHAAQVMLLKTKCVIGFRISRFNAIGDPVKYLENLTSMIDKRTSRFKYHLFAESDTCCKNLHDPFPLVAGFVGADFSSQAVRFLCSGEGLLKLQKKYAVNLESLEFYYQPRRKTLSTRLACDFVKLFTKLVLLCSCEPSLQDFDEECIKNVFFEFLVVQQYERLFARTGPSAINVLSAQIQDSLAGALRESVMMRSFTEPQKAFLKEFSRKLIDGASASGVPDAVEDRWSAFFAELQIALQKLWTLSVVEVFRSRETVLLLLSENAPLFSDTVPGINDFHNYLAHRANVFRIPVNACDSYESELSTDVQCRLATLTENPEAWNSLVKELCDSVRSFLPQSLQSVFESRFANIVFQAFFGVYSHYADKRLLCSRIVEYFRLKIRLARVYSDPVKPDLEFERQFAECIGAIVFQKRESRFYQTFEEFYLKFAPFGALLSVSFAILQCTVPGIPELGMGSEMTSLCLGAQDRRNEVSLKQLAEAVESERLNAQRQSDEIYLQELLLNWSSGKMKLYVYNRLMHLRMELPKLFLEGKYKPIKVAGAHSGHLFAFMRTHDTMREMVLVVVSRGLMSMNVGFSNQFPRFEWDDHHLVLEEYEGTSWVDVFTGFAYNHVERKIHLGLLLRTVPFAVLKGA